MMLLSSKIYAGLGASRACITEFSPGSAKTLATTTQSAQVIHLSNLQGGKSLRDALAAVEVESALPKERVRNNLDISGCTDRRATA